MDSGPKIGFIVEGDDDKEIVEVLARRVLGERLGSFSPWPWRIQTVRIGGRAALHWANDAVVDLLAMGCVHVVLVMDADTSTKFEVERRRQHLEQRLGRQNGINATVCLAVPEIHAWLLSAFVEHPEAVRDTKAALQRHLDGRAQRSSELGRLAEELNLEEAGRRSPSLRRFLDVLRSLAEQPAPALRA
jgi:hypothetical protein